MPYHYVYFLHLVTGQYYIGKRSCSCLPQDDFSYLGSSKHIKPSQVISKTIIKLFETEKEAQLAEIQLHAQYKVASSEVFANRAEQKSTGFFAPFAKKQSKEQAQKSADSRKRKDVFDFYHKQHGVFTGTLYDFYSTFNIRRGAAVNLVKGTRLSCVGWTLSKDMDSYASQKNQEVYTFYHKQGSIFTGTTYDLGVMYKFSASQRNDLRRVARGQLPSAQGWGLSPNLDYAAKPANRSSVLYTIYNKEKSHTMVGTMYDFYNIHGLLTKDGAYKVCRLGRKSRGYQLVCEKTP